MGRYKVDQTTGELTLLNPSIEDIPIFQGVNGSIVSISGMLPASQSGDEDKVFNGRGEWGKRLQIDIVTQNGQYGYINANNEFVAFKSQADIDAAVAAAMVGTATAADVLTGTTFTNSSQSGISGEMANNGAVSPSGLNCGGSYTIPAGYHNGSGKVTANSLSSQTGVDSGKTAVTAGTMVSGYQGWVNGSKISGTFAGQTKSTTSSRTAQTITPDSGKYLTSVSIAKYPDASGTYTPSANSSASDMGATNNYRYVDTRTVYSLGSSAGLASGYTTVAQVSSTGGSASAGYTYGSANGHYYLVVCYNLKGCSIVSGATAIASGGPLNSYFYFNIVKATTTTMKLKFNSAVNGSMGTGSLVIRLY